MHENRLDPKGVSVEAVLTHTPQAMLTSVVLPHVEMLLFDSPYEAAVEESGAPDVGREAPPEGLPGHQGHLLQLSGLGSAVHSHRIGVPVAELVKDVHVGFACGGYPVGQLRGHKQHYDAGPDRSYHGWFRPLGRGKSNLQLLPTRYYHIAILQEHTTLINKPF